MFGAILLLGQMVKSTSADVCSNACGSLANSRNPLGDMNNLLTSGMNCSNGPYYPLTTSPQSYNDGSVCNAFYPQQPSTYPSTYSQQPSTYPQQPFTGGIGTTPVSPFVPAGQNDAECEITTSVECKPRKNNNNNLLTPSTYPGLTMPQQPGIGNGQTCDCSQYNLTAPNGGYITPVPGMTLTNDPCNCASSQSYNTSNYGNSTSPMISNGYNNYTSPNGFGSLNKPAFCGSGMVGGKPAVGNAILNAFDCNKSYTMPPTRSAIVGTTELPIADNFRASPSSCSIANSPCAS